MAMAIKGAILISMRHGFGVSPAISPMNLMGYNYLVSNGIDKWLFSEVQCMLFDIQFIRFFTREILNPVDD